VSDTHWVVILVRLFWFGWDLHNVYLQTDILEGVFNLLIMTNAFVFLWMLERCNQHVFVRGIISLCRGMEKSCGLQDKAGCRQGEQVIGCLLNSCPCVDFDIMLGN
jgi:hypothetical protein